MQQLRIFIVEDNAIELGGFCAMLEDLGHEVAGTASNGEEAVNCARELEGKADVILMDINLPKMDGLTASKKLKQFCQIPVVIMTGYNSDKIMISEEIKNVYGYIQKPVEPAELGACIKIAYDQFREAQKIRKELTSKTQELEERKIIERAKGIVMRMNGCTEEQAMVRLQKKSRENNIKLSVMARNIVETINKLDI